MSSEKLTFGPGMPERSALRDRAGGPPSVLLGASAVFASVVVVAVIVHNIGHEMGELRARVERDREDIAKLQARAERDQGEIFALRERIVVLETQSRESGGSFLTTNSVEQQTPDQTDPVPNPESDVSVISNAGVQQYHARGTPAHLHTHRREAPNANWVRLPAGSYCYWEGDSPFCRHSGCKRGYRAVASSDCGDGACCFTGSKIYCCAG